MFILYTRSGRPLPANYKDEKGNPICLRDRPCTRCGGVGGSEAWRVTGWTCFRCAGNGKDPVQERNRLYTPEQNAKLDAMAEKRAAKKAADRAEAARIEQERRDRERAEIISANEGFVARIDAELAHGDMEVLQSVRDRIIVEAKEPTDRQVEVVNRIIERNSKERARRETAKHVGEVKKRQTFTLTLLYTQSHVISEYPLIMSHWSLFTDENGCKIASKSSPRLFGFPRHKETRQYIKGSVSRVKATVVEHTTDKNGEPITYVNRPKVES